MTDNGKTIPQEIPPQATARDCCDAAAVFEAGLMHLLRTHQRAAPAPHDDGARRHRGPADGRHAASRIEVSEHGIAFIGDKTIRYCLQAADEFGDNQVVRWDDDGRRRPQLVGLAEVEQVFAGLERAMPRLEEA